VVGAKVTITNAATNVSRAITSNSVGDYLAPTLRPGQYVVSAEAAGFKKAVSTPVTLEVARDVRVDLSLHAGGINEVMEVTAEGTLADSTDSTLNGVLSNKAITELPLQGRDFQNLLNLHPGVQRTPGGVSIPSRRTATVLTTTTSSSMAPMTTTSTMERRC